MESRVTKKVEPDAAATHLSNFVVLAKEPQHLLAALAQGLQLRLNARRVVASALGVADATRPCPHVPGGESAKENE